MKFIPYVFCIIATSFASIGVHYNNYGLATFCILFIFILVMDPDSKESTNV